MPSAGAFASTLITDAARALALEKTVTPALTQLSDFVTLLPERLL